MHIALLAGANWVHWLTSAVRAFCSSVRHPVALCALEYCCKSALQLLRTSYVGTSSAFATLAWTPRDTAAIATTIPSFVMFGLHQANLKARFQSSFMLTTVQLFSAGPCPACRSAICGHGHIPGHHPYDV